MELSTFCTPKRRDANAFPLYPSSFPPSFSLDIPLGTLFLPLPLPLFPSLSFFTSLSVSPQPLSSRLFSLCVHSLLLFSLLTFPLSLFPFFFLLFRFSPCFALSLILSPLFFSSTFLSNCLNTNNFKNQTRQRWVVPGLPQYCLQFASNALKGPTIRQFLRCRQPGVDFTKLCAPSEKTPANGVWQKICRSISPTIASGEYKAKICVKFDKFVRRLPNAVPHKKLLIFDV